MANKCGVRKEQAGKPASFTDFEPPAKALFLAAISASCEEPKDVEIQHADRK
jgi:hypothetical protein